MLAFVLETPTSHCIHNIDDISDKSLWKYISQENWAKFSKNLSHWDKLNLLSKYSPASNTMNPALSSEALPMLKVSLGYTDLILLTGKRIQKQPVACVRQAPWPSTVAASPPLRAAPIIDTDIWSLELLTLGTKQTVNPQPVKLLHDLKVQHSMQMQVNIHKTCFFLVYNTLSV